MKLLSSIKQLQTIAILALVLSFAYVSSAQPINQAPCIRTDFEPNQESIQYRAVSSSNIDSLNHIPWTNPEDAAVNSSNAAVSSLNPGQRSTPLEFKSFYADIPDGSTIHGVQLRLTGSGTNNNFISEKEIRFYLDGEPLSSNIAGKSDIAFPWKETETTWYYGFEHTTWNVDWSEDLLLDPNLSLRIVLDNSSNDEVIEAVINGLEIIVHYTPLYTLCGHDCVVFYVDPIQDATSYDWTLPDGTKYLNADPHSHSVNLDFSDTNEGLLNVSVIANTSTGPVHCSREILHDPCRDGVIGDFVFFDSNFDGSQKDEIGLADVSLKLLNVYDEEIQEVETDNDGFYQFENILRGFYYIQLDEDNVAAAPANATNEDEDSDLNADLRTGIFYMNGDSITNLDFGIFLAGSISGTIWSECDGDGNYNIIEDNLLSGVHVDLKRNGAVIGGTETNENGYYIFENLFPGEYTLSLSNVDDISDSNMSNNNAQNVFNSLGEFDVELGLGDELENIDAAIHNKSQITILIYEDANNNGVMDDGEHIYDGNEFDLYSGDELIATALVAEGLAIFEDISGSDLSLRIQKEADFFIDAVPGVYTVDFEDDHFIFTDFAEDCQAEINLTFIAREGGAIIGNYVWMDSNADGIQDPNENGIPGVRIQLVDFTTAAVIAETETDENGYYNFLDLSPGNYILFLQFDQDFDATIFNAAPTKGSKLLKIDDVFSMGIITIIGTEYQSIWDAGVTESLASIGDFVWIDMNKDGLQDDDDLPLVGAFINLHREDGTVFSSTSSNENGKYQFTVPAGEYYLSFTHPEYSEYTEFLISADENLNSDVDPILGQTPIITLGQGEIRNDIDAGFIPHFATIGDFVFLDENGDGLQGDDEIGLSNFTVEAFDVNAELVSSTATESDGSYQLQVPPGTYFIKFSKATFTDATIFNATNDEKNSDITGSYGPGTTELITVSAFEVRNDIDAGFPPVMTSIGDYVWNDGDQDGTQEFTEGGIIGVEVNLYKVGEGMVASTMTGNGIDAPRGSYEFQLMEKGEYYIEFILPNENWEFTQANQGGNEEFDNDVTGANGPGTTSVFYLEPGQNIENIDAGAESEQIIFGDFFWLDLNEDGLQNNLETGVNGLTVFLYDEFFNFLDVTITTYNPLLQKDGYYQFENIEPGNYIVVFDSENEFVPAHVGNDPEKDSDVTNAFVKGSTDVISLVANQNTFSIDAGILPETSTPSGSIGNMVWEDINENGIYENGEKGIEGIVIQLLDSNQNSLANVTTDASGHYEFTGLNAGDYRIFCELPDNYKFTIPNNSFDDETDSDIQSDGYSLIFEIQEGESNESVDIGLIRLTDEEEVINEVDAELVAEEAMEEDEFVVINLGEPQNSVKETPVEEESELDKQIIVFPNPTNGQFTVQIPWYKTATARIDLVDAQGVIRKSVFSGSVEEGKQEILVNFDNAQSGNYYIRILSDSGIRFKKLIIH